MKTTAEELVWLSATELAALYRARSVSPVDVVTAVLQQLDEREPTINAFVTTTPEAAVASAREAERLFRTSEGLPPLLGIPVTVKDLIDTAGVRTTYGSTLFEDHVPEEDDVCWSRLKAAGAILIGKTTTPEFGMLGVTESRLTGVTRNPWDPARTAGGSSGGAAASVASGIAPVAWGNDGGGSIRVPAACCGVVGLKPSMGRIPQDHDGFVGAVSCGPLTRTVRDAALVLSLTSGPHPKDPLSLPSEDPSTFIDAVGEPSLKGLRVAYAEHFGVGPVTDEVTTAVATAVTTFAELGAVVDRVEIRLPDPIQYFIDFWAPGFAVAIDELRELPGWSDSRMHPTMIEFADAARPRSAIDQWLVSIETRGDIVAGFNRVFESFDLLVTPTMPLVAFPHPGPEAGPTEVAGQSVRLPAVDFHRLTEPPSHAGLPAITLPCGFTSDHIPVGMQLIGPRHEDAAILAAAAAYEAATEWHLWHPSVAGQGRPVVERQGGK